MPEPRPRWIAVDRDGLVGRFLPGAEGAIPEHALAPGRVERLERAIDIARVLRRLVDGTIDRARPDALASDRMLVVLRDDDTGEPRYRSAARAPETAVEARLAPFSPTVWREPAPRAFVTEDEVDVPTIIALAQDPGVSHLLGLRDVRAMARALVPRDTMYELRHEPGPGDGTRYRRTSAPRTRPLHESELPERERAALTAVRAPTGFAASELVDVSQLETHALPDDAPDPEELVHTVEPIGPTWVKWVIGSAAAWAVLKALSQFFG